MALTPELEAVRALLSSGVALGGDGPSKADSSDPGFDVGAARQEAERAARSGVVDAEVAVERLVVAGRPAASVRAPSVPADVALLYLHGGGYVCGSVDSRLSLCGRLSRSLDTTVLLLGYRQAPEDPFPAALEDAVAGARWLVDRPGATTERWVLAGDSAGGGLAVATATTLRDAGARLPDAVVLLAPWADLTLPTMDRGNSRLASYDPDGLGRRAELAAMARLYLAGHDPEDPRASPLRADLAGLPPTFIQVGADDVLIDDALRLHDRLRDSGVEAVTEVWDDMPHVFQRYPSLQESDEALDRIASFVRKALP